MKINKTSNIYKTHIKQKPKLLSESFPYIDDRVNSFNGGKNYFYGGIKD